jgi:hypothetical protein
MVRRRTRLVGATIAGALALAGCASGAVIHATIGSASAFCTDLGTFSNQAQGLNDAAGDTPATLVTSLKTVTAELDKLVGEAPTADTVNNHLVKADLKTEASAFDQLVTNLGSASPDDPNATANALKEVESSQGGTLVDATNRLDDYSKSVCKISVSSTSTTAGPSTTAAASTTAAPAAVTVAPGSTVAPASGAVGPAASTVAPTGSGGAASTSTTVANP